jgi:hypothetical protein
MSGFFPMAAIAADTPPKRWPFVVVVVVVVVVDLDTAMTTTITTTTTTGCLAGRPHTVLGK